MIKRHIICSYVVDTLLLYLPNNICRWVAWRAHTWEARCLASDKVSCCCCSFVIHNSNMLVWYPLFFSLSELVCFHLTRISAICSLSIVCMLIPIVCLLSFNGSSVCLFVSSLFPPDLAPRYWHIQWTHFASLLLSIVGLMLSDVCFLVCIVCNLYLNLWFICW